MRTTLDIDANLLHQVVKLSGEKNKGKAVNKALAEYVRRQKLEELSRMIGTIGLECDWRKEEDAELEEIERRIRPS
jgi:Arc/MetJ family transcription regulator